MDLSGNRDREDVELEDGRIVSFSRSQFLTHQPFLDRINNHYKKLKTTIKVYEDRRNKGIWWMAFIIN